MCHLFQYFPKGTVTWTITDKDGKIVIPEPDPHGIQKANNGAVLVINEGGLDNDSNYTDPDHRLVSAEFYLLVVECSLLLLKSVNVSSLGNEQ